MKTLNPFIKMKATQTELALVVPAEVIEAFAAKFPSVKLTDVEWSWEVYNKIYEAEFELNGIEHEVEITVTGHHLLTETEIEIDEIPDTVLKAIENEFPEAEITEVEKVVWSTGKVFYELDLQTENDDEFEVHVSEEGIITAKSDDL
jgi:uncharacterized membrane protein YkoI